MKRFLALAALALTGLLLTSVAFAVDANRGATRAKKTDSSPGHFLCKCSHPWPFGCGHPMDADGDGVKDAMDRCPDTPRGATVDATGCPMDSDGDGVADGIDTCPGTPKGTMVDKKGCPRDSDGDGVFDGMDTCPDTPKGATVDAAGCPMDSDGDGVFDGIDQCPGTSKEWAVDKKGCPIPVNETYQQFLDQKSVSVNVQFSSARSDILPASEADLRRVGEVLADWPEAKVEIGGHTDSQGSSNFNKTLSENRAKSVKAWLVAHFPTIKPGHLTPRGYGEGQPVASNDSAEGRARNRRVTFTLMNADELGKDVETRRYKKRGE